MVGSSEQISSVASALELPDLSLNSAVSALNTRVQALSDENLADLDRRLQAILTQLDALKKKQASEPSEHAERVNELFELTRRWDGVAASVPTLVERLKSLRTLHEQGADFSKTLTHLESVQQQIASQLSAQSTALSNVEESFQKNISTIEGNFQALDRRIASLVVSMDKLK
eukprot:m.80297 g.80297  ORF g.80297 m.80297 type:complete len:172 (+) comp8203_c0_seq1:755-1270(+)